MLLIVIYWQVTLGISFVKCYVISLALRVSGYDVTFHQIFRGKPANITRHSILFPKYSCSCIDRILSNFLVSN